ncbi:MAG TPA: carboxypeptidase-like regulatory domain-containing protein [Bryobacteraceae bacterium]|nr:carboxypeptidase-like regulatory domain-containing protein [Bryobacteraceae bacterium]
MRLAVAATLLLPSAAFVACAVSLPFCQCLPDAANSETAIFVGLVTEVITPERTPPPAQPSRQTEAPDGVLPQGRRRATDPLPPAPKFRYPVARLQVIENFLGANTAEFEVRLTSDHFVNDVPQQYPPMGNGELWFVEAYRNGSDHQWMVSSCGRSKPAERAAEDLRVLRAWASGQTLPARVYGEVFDRTAVPQYAPGVRVVLRGEHQTLTAVTDNAGRFAFENLPPGIYEASGPVPLPARPVRIDLTHAWCWHVIFQARP